MEFKPHAYQQHCINRIIEVKKLGLFLDMGLGKTVTTLTAIRELKYNRFQVRKVLVIAPKKVAEGTWTKEKDKWDHTRILRVSPVLGSQARRIRALNTPADIYIINRENVVWLVEHYRDGEPYREAGGADRDAVAKRPCGSLEPGIPAGRRGAVGEALHAVQGTVFPAG